VLRVALLAWFDCDDAGIAAARSEIEEIAHQTRDEITLAD
jgi:hypothetical protein